MDFVESDFTVLLSQSKFEVVEAAALSAVIGSISPCPKDCPLCMQVSRCTYCDLDCPLIPGVLGEQQQTAAAASADSAAATAVPQQHQQQSPVSRDSLLKETEHCKVWLDAKGRPTFVITPHQHLGKLSDLSDAELVDLFRTAASVPQEMGCSYNPSYCSINTMVLDHGNNRDHAHRACGVRVHACEFNNVASALWTSEQQAQLDLLRDFALQMPQRQQQQGQ